MSETDDFANQSLYMFNIAIICAVFKANLHFGFDFVLYTCYYYIRDGIILIGKLSRS